jgi:hypothetical protein
LFGAIGFWASGFGKMMAADRLIGIGGASAFAGADWSLKIRIAARGVDPLRAEWLLGNACFSTSGV